jgi:hypothetical protein
MDAHGGTDRRNAAEVLARRRARDHLWRSLGRPFPFGAMLAAWALFVPLSIYVRGLTPHHLPLLLAGPFVLLAAYGLCAAGQALRPAMYYPLWVMGVPAAFAAVLGGALLARDGSLPALEAPACILLGALAAAAVPWATIARKTFPPR